MSLDKRNKINDLLQKWPHGTVCLTTWLTHNGYSYQLLNRYKKSNWIKSIGSGAVKRSGDAITVEGAIYGLQKQAGSYIHPGGKTALSLLGKAHYLELSHHKKTLFGETHEKLPTWFINYPWQSKVNYYGTNFLPGKIGLVKKEINNFTIQMSGAPRALMECLYLAPQKQDLIECYELMEGLNNLRPTVVQALLEACSSVKVKRLFLYMAEKAGHVWLEYLDLQKINLGKGNRSLVENGSYIAKYKITVPKALKSYDEL